MLKTSVPFMVIFLLSGCGHIAHKEVSIASKLVPTEDGFILTSGVAGTWDDEGERLRLSVMQEKVNAAGVCQNGYDIVKRDVVMNSHQPVFFAPVGTIFYHARCRPGGS
ncbi:MAG: hypothetical protein ACOVS5_17860 [Oligoflexus sp.]